MAQPQVFWDRVTIMLNGTPYLPDGQIRDFSITASYNDNLVQSMTGDGSAIGIVFGNKSVSLNWTELLTPQSQYLNWGIYVLANPNTTLTIIPVSIATGIPAAPQFTVTGLGRGPQSPNASGEGQAMMKHISLIAARVSNL